MAQFLAEATELLWQRGCLFSQSRAGVPRRMLVNAVCRAGSGTSLFCEVPLEPRGSCLKLISRLQVSSDSPEVDLLGHLAGGRLYRDAGIREAACRQHLMFRYLPALVSTNAARSQSLQAGGADE